MTLPTITALPQLPNRQTRPTTFAADADATFDAFPAFIDELNEYGEALNAGALGQWTQIGSNVGTTSGSTVTFANIPANYRDLRFQFQAVSASSAASLQMAFSINGSAYSTAVTVASILSGADQMCGEVFIADYRASFLAARAVLADIRTDPVAAAANAALAVRLGGPLTHVRFSLSTGSFDGGLIQLKGR